MTNYVSNRWDVEGPEADLDAFEALVLTPEAAPAPRLGLVARLGLRRQAPATRLPRGPDFDRIAPPPAVVAADPRALSEWRVEAWGTSRTAEAQSYARSPGRARLEFATAWAHPAGLVAALASRLPAGLVVAGAYVEPGNEVAGRFRVEGGRFEDEELPFTAAFYEEVTGEKLDD